MVFGSLVRGRFTQDLDIDLAVEKILPERYFEAVARASDEEAGVSRQWACFWLVNYSSDEKGIGLSARARAELLTATEKILAKSALPGFF